MSGACSADSAEAGDIRGACHVGRAAGLAVQSLLPSQGHPLTRLALRVRRGVGWGRQLSPEVSRASGVLRHLWMMAVARPGCRDGVLWSRPGLKEAKTHSKRENCLLSDNHSPLGSLSLLTFLRTGLIPPVDSPEPRNISKDSPGLVLPWSRIAPISCFRSFTPLGVSLLPPLSPALTRWEGHLVPPQPPTQRRGRVMGRGSEHH